MDDPGLAEILRRAGGEIVETEPDVEIASRGTLRGDARYAVVVLEARAPTGESRLLRAASRLVRATRVRGAALLALRSARSRGYRADLYVWDPDRGPLLHRARPLASPRDFASLPLRSLVVAARADAPVTIADDCAAAASRSLGQPFHAQTFLLGDSGVLVALGGQHVLRVAVGPAAAQIERQAAFLRSFTGNGVPESVRTLVPGLVATRTRGLAVWSLEERLPGAHPSSPDPPSLLADCAVFLAELFALGGERAPDRVASRAEIVVRVLGPETSSVRRLALDLDRALGSVVRGLAHGDFWSENILVSGRRLSGVVDWVGAGDGRLPLLDFIHLLAAFERSRTRRPPGRIVVERLLPWARRGGDSVARGYCERIGLEPDPALLERLVLAYWLDRSASELERYPERGDSRAWVRANMTCVLEALRR